MDSELCYELCFVRAWISKMGERIHMVSTWTLLFIVLDIQRQSVNETFARLLPVQRLDHYHQIYKWIGTPVDGVLDK